MEINENDVGKEFLAALELAINIRKERRLIYCDSFKEDDVNLLLTILKGKINRIEKGLSEDKKLDDALDCLNYSCFIATKFMKGGE